MLSVCTSAASFASVRLLHRCAHAAAHERTALPAVSSGARTLLRFARYGSVVADVAG